LLFVPQLCRGEESLPKPFHNNNFDSELFKKGGKKVERAQSADFRFGRGKPGRRLHVLSDNDFLDWELGSAKNLSRALCRHALPADNSMEVNVELMYGSSSCVDSKILMVNFFLIDATVLD